MTKECFHDAEQRKIDEAVAGRMKDKEDAKRSLLSRIDRLSGLLAGDADWEAIRKLLALKFLREDRFRIFIDELLHIMPYRQYLKTHHWKKTSDEAKRKAGFRCRLCNASGELHTHHRTYEHRGGEPEEDLIVLCADCHGKFHDKLPEGEGEDT